MWPSRANESLELQQDLFKKLSSVPGLLSVSAIFPLSGQNLQDNEANPGERETKDEGEKQF